MGTKRGTGGPLRRAVEQVLSACGQEGRLAEARVLASWEEIAGPQVAARSAPVLLRAGVLTVGVTSPPWMSQLQFLREELVRKVNAAIGEELVREVRLVPAAAARTLHPHRAAATAEAPPTEEEIGLVDEACRPLADPELRDLLRRVLLRQAVLVRRRGTVTR